MSLIQAGTSKIIKYYDTFHPISSQNNFLNVVFVKEISISQFNMDMHSSNYVFCQYHKNSMFGALVCIQSVSEIFGFTFIRITHFPT